ncbi:MAG: hypothetical protein ACK53Q_11950, partial [Dolichospermum sp.]
MQFVQNLLFQRGSDRTPSNFPTSFFNEPRRREEHEERREERAIALPQPPNSDTFGQVRYRISSPTSFLISRWTEENQNIFSFVKWLKLNQN